MAGSTITVTSSATPRAATPFPPPSCRPGTTALRIRAAGYDLAGPDSAEVAAGKAATADLKLKKTSDLAAQLSNGEWLASFPAPTSRRP